MFKLYSAMVAIFDLNNVNFTEDLHVDMGTNKMRVVNALLLHIFSVFYEYLNVKHLQMTSLGNSSHRSSNLDELKNQSLP
jgi:hypothetical protein